jgi:hypothetical protein
VNPSDKLQNISLHVNGVALDELVFVAFLCFRNEVGDRCGKIPDIGFLSGPTW